ncbi:heterokaryon incompatibility protein-domain-containing protein [Xylariaceae sp. AK1471]|nr:heterokaryon incompatibility protein-domain-containing protein [Xylariaceae sp. AK1471]
MRLIHCRCLQLREFVEPNIPNYAILSHTWDDGEVTLVDFLRGPRMGSNGISKGWEKIIETCKMATTQGYEYVWVDTCCIDKSSSAELTEAINSMYAWYAGSGKCFAYLSDFDPSNHNIPTPNAHFLSSRWFSRGWTLQELIAPSDVEFYDSSWNRYGSKANLCADIAYATGIDESVLFRTGPDLQDLLAAIPICQKMSWASGRETRRLEDMAYCLLGIFGVHMPLIYGEGSKAFIRLQRKIIESTNDLTILAWKTEDQPHPWDHFSVLAQSPKSFSNSKDIVLSQDLRYNPDFSITNKGLRVAVTLPVIYGIEKPIMSLYCYRKDRPYETLGIYLGFIGGEVYSRALPNVIPVEKEGQRSCDTSVFLSIEPRKTKIASSSLVRGHHFTFKYTYPPEMTDGIRLLSSYPDKRWDERFGFRARDTPAFVGINTYQACWRDRVMKFVVVCGFRPAVEPWACINAEGSELWYATAQRDFLRAGGLAESHQTGEISLRSTLHISVGIKPFLGKDDEPRWMQIEIRADRRRKDDRALNLRAEHLSRRLINFRDQRLLLPEPDVTYLVTPPRRLSG